MSPLELYTAPAAETSAPLTPGVLEPGGVLELHKRQLLTLRNLVTNPGFESGSSAYAAAGGSSRGVSAVKYYSGQYAFRFQGVSAADIASGNVYVDIPITGLVPGNYMIAAAKLWGPRSSVGAGIRVEFYWTTGGSVNQDFEYVANTWITIGRTAQVPANTTSGTLRLWVCINGKLSPGDDVYIDDIMVTQAPVNVAFTDIDPFTGDSSTGYWEGDPSASTSVSAQEVFTRIAFLDDVRAGLRLKQTLLGLNKLDFYIPKDRFSPSSGDNLADLDEAWRVARSVIESPYGKSKSTRDSLWLFYRTQNQEFRFRINTLDYDDDENLAGSALDGAVSLSDTLTQYVPGRSAFAGVLPSEYANRQLRGWQNLRIQNRRFTRDKPVRMQIANDLPDMTPNDRGTRMAPATQSAPLPFVAELPAINPKDVDLFSGLASNTIPPSGVLRTPPTTGGFGYLAFKDANFPTNLTFAPRRFANFTRLYSDSTLSGPINYSIASPNPFIAGEDYNFMSRVIYGAIKASATGHHLFEWNSLGGTRVYFQGKPVGLRMLNQNTSLQVNWHAYLEANKWYPIIIHQCHSQYGIQMSLYWTPPDTGVRVLVPSAQMSPNLFDGLCCVRFTDSMGLVRFAMCYKRWDGKALVLAYPLPATIFNARIINGPDWPKQISAGTLVEEVSFPSDIDAVRVNTWGSGWSRRAGRRTLDNPPVETATMAPMTSGY